MVFGSFLLLVVMMSFLLVSCEESPTKPNDVYGANLLASEGMQMLNQVILDMNESNTEITGADDLMLESTFLQIEAKFKAALEVDTYNPMASLGMSILEIVRINYDPELWDMINEMNDMGGGSKRIINNQIKFLAETPKLVFKQMQPNRTNSLSIKRLQDYVISSVIPRLSNSISYLDRAVALADSNAIMIDTGEEWLEIDCGEIYAFRAATNMVYAAFNMMVAYDYDLKDAANSYQWITELNEIEVEYVDDWYPYSYTIQDGHLVVDYYEWDYSWNLEDALREEIMGKVLKHNLENSTSFGKLRGQTYLNQAKAGILRAAADVKNCTAYILNETDSQVNDIIKIENIMSLNAEFENISPNDPNFMQGWTSIDDVATWLETIVSGSYSLNENGVSFEVNLGAFFGGAISDVRDILPYHQWNQEDTWVEYSFEEYTYPYSSYSFYMNGQYHYFENLLDVTWRYKKVRANVAEFTDASGTPIGDDEFPFFPDYTFRGVMPGMTRAKFIQLFD